MIYVGIDVGMSGAVAIIPDPIDKESIFGIEVFDTPMTLVGKKHVYNLKEMVVMLSKLRNRSILDDPVLVGIEQVHSMPKEGVHSAFVFGRGAGLWEGMVAAFGLKYEMITPQRWKKAMMDGMPKEKGASIVVARRLFPEVDLPRKKDHGKADALLIAEYLRRTYRPK